MSKKYKGKVCVYCARAPSTAADHVIAREFFLVNRRSNLPKVPVCDACNQEKSDLEHYLTAVFPFGGRHPDAAVNLATMVPNRLKKNVRLHKELAAALGQRPIEHSGTRPDRGERPLSLPIDHNRVERLFIMIVKGLVWNHWQVLLGTNDSAIAAAIRDAGVPVLDRLLFSRNARNRVKVVLGQGTFCYEGLQATDSPQLTIWKFSVYGGLCLGGDPTAPDERSSQIFAATGPEKLIRELQSTLFGEVDRTK